MCQSLGETGTDIETQYLIHFEAIDTAKHGLCYTYFPLRQYGMEYMLSTLCVFLILSPAHALG